MNSESSGRLGRILRVAVLVALFVVASLVAYRVLVTRPVDTDAFWHIKTGEWIVQHRAIPTTDVFSWFGQEHHTAWLPHEWLFDVLAYGLWSIGGFALLYLKIAGIAGAATLAVFALTWTRSRNWTASLAVALIALFGFGHFVSPRPGTLTFLLLPLVALMLEKKWWVAALAIMVVGVNVHGAMYPIYLLVFAFYALPGKPWVLAGSLAAVLVTPLTYRLLPYPLFAFDSQVVQFQEYAPTILAKNYLMLALLVGLWFGLDRKRMPLRDAIAGLILAGLAIKATRNTTLFYLLGLPLLAPYVKGVTPAEKLAADATGEPAAAPFVLDARPDARFDAVLLAALLVGALVIGAQVLPARIDPDKGFPAGAVAYVRSHGITRVWNEWGDGGYLIFKGVPSLIDGRADPFSPFFHKDVTLAPEYVKSYYDEADVRPLLRKYGIRYMIVGREIPIYRVLEQSRDFKPAYSDAETVVFEFAPSGEASATP